MDELNKEILEYEQHLKMLKNRVYNIYDVVDELKIRPHTYKSLLEDLYEDATLLTILRRKLSKLHKKGDVFKCKIPGTCFGARVFYNIEKEYHILIEANRTGSKLYYFYDYNQLDDNNIFCETCYILRKNKWEKIVNKQFYRGKVLKFL